MSTGGRQVTVPVAAELAKCHQETIRRAIRAKELLAKRHPTKPGRPWLIYVTDLSAWLEKRSLA